MKRRTLGCALALATVVIAGSGVTTGTASAAGTVAGVLGIHGAGTTFVGSQGIVTRSVQPGSTANYTLRVTNVGSVTAGYELLFFRYPGPNFFGEPDFQLSLTKGTLLQSPVTPGPDGGYPTSLLTPGQSQSFTLKVIIPSRGVDADYQAAVVIDLTNNGAPLDTLSARTEITGIPGTDAQDIYSSNSATSTVLSEPSSGNVLVASAGIKPNATTTYTARIQNDSSRVTQFIAGLRSDRNNCPQYWAVKATVAGNDVTTALRLKSFAITLKPGAALTMTIAVTLPAAPQPSTCFEVEVLGVSMVDSEGGTGVGFVVNPQQVLSSPGVVLQ